MRESFLQAFTARLRVDIALGALEKNNVFRQLTLDGVVLAAPIQSAETRGMVPKTTPCMPWLWTRSFTLPSRRLNFTQRMSGSVGPFSFTLFVPSFSRSGDTPPDIATSSSSLIASTPRAMACVIHCSRNSTFNSPQPMPLEMVGPEWV